MHEERTAFLEKHIVGPAATSPAARDQRTLPDLTRSESIGRVASENLEPAVHIGPSTRTRDRASRRDEATEGLGLSAATIRLGRHARQPLCLSGPWTGCAGWSQPRRGSPPNLPSPPDAHTEQRCGPRGSTAGPRP